MTSADDLRRELAAMKWFHAIDFGEVASSGRFRPGSPQNITLYGAMELLGEIELEGAVALDIGAVDGLASFGIKALGADRVIATDSVDKETFRRSRELLGLDVEYRPRMQVKDLASVFEPGSFDLILCAGVVYHMLNPVRAFVECRKLIKERGLAIFETAFEPAVDRATIFVNSEEAILDEPFTYSVPTRGAVLGLMKLVGFDVLAVRTLSSPARLTVLGRAVQPAEVRDRTPLLKRMHDLDFCDFEFTRADWTASRPSSAIAYRGPEDEVEIDPRSHEPDFPFHPPRDREAVGSTVWMSPEGNR